MNRREQAIRAELERRLIEDRSELLWSYKRGPIQSLPDDLIIEKLLLSGDRQDWIDLKKAFKQEHIKRIWMEDMLMGGLRLERQKELVRFFFGAKNPSMYISQNKRRQLERSFARGF